MVNYCKFAKKNEVLHDFTGRLCFRRGKEILTGADLRQEARDKGQPVPKRSPGRPPKTPTERPVPRPRGRPKKAVSSPKVSKGRGRPKGSGKGSSFGTKAQVMADETGRLRFRRGKKILTRQDLIDEWVSRHPAPSRPLPIPPSPRGRPSGPATPGKKYGTKSQVMADYTNTLLFKRGDKALTGEYLRREAQIQAETSNNLASIQGQMRGGAGHTPYRAPGLIPKSQRHKLPWLEPPPAGYGRSSMDD